MYTQKHEKSGFKIHTAWIWIRMAKRPGVTSDAFQRYAKGQQISKGKYEVVALPKI